MSDPLLRLDQVSFSYGKRVLFDSVDLVVNPGELVTIAGKSGSGKSTLLYILGAFLKPDKGEYLFRGRGVFSLGEFGLGKFRRKNLGFVFQDFRLLQFLNVEQNVKFPVWFSGQKFHRPAFEQLLQQLGIENRRKAYPKDISGGEAQRCAIGRALVLQPALLLLDEPTGNLDERTEAEILDLLLELKKAGLALVVVTHSSMMMKNSDSVYHLAEGKLSLQKKIGVAEPGSTARKTSERKPESKTKKAKPAAKKASKTTKTVSKKKSKAARKAKKGQS